MKRRHLLGIISMLSASGSGCTGIVGREQNFLGEITIGNRDAEPHIVSVAVEHEGELIHLTHHQLDSFDESTQVADSDSIRRGWPQESGETVIYVQFDNRDIRKQQLSDLPEYGCYEITVLIDEKGRLNILHSKGCSSE